MTPISEPQFWSWEMGLYLRLSDEDIKALH